MINSLLEKNDSLSGLSLSLQASSLCSTSNSRGLLRRYQILSVCQDLVAVITWFREALRGPSALVPPSPAALGCLSY